MNKILSKIGSTLAQHSPAILTGLSVAGVVTTVTMAVRATPKAMALIENERYENKIFDSLPVKDVIVLTWKEYVPTAAMGIITICCILGANTVNQKRIAALAGLYSLSEKALKTYQDKVVEILGDKKHREIKDAVAKERVDVAPVKDSEIIFTGKGSTLCYDNISGRYFHSSMESIRKIVNDVNEDLLHDGFVTLNDMYYELGLPNIKIGDQIGWRMDDGLIDLDPSTQFATNGEPCIVLDYITGPNHNYTRR